MIVFSLHCLIRRVTKIDTRKLTNYWTSKFLEYVSGRGIVANFVQMDFVRMMITLLSGASVDVALSRTIQRKSEKSHVSADYSDVIRRMDSARENVRPPPPPRRVILSVSDRMHLINRSHDEEIRKILRCRWHNRGTLRSHSLTKSLNLVIIWIYLKL